MYFRKKTSGGRAYLQIVESRRDGGQVRQQVIATLGRYEDLREERPIRTAVAVGGTVFLQSDGGGRRPGRECNGIGSAAAWARSGIPAFVGRNRMPRRGRRD